MSRSRSARAEATARDLSSEREYRTVPEAARLLGVSTSTVWRWIQAGRLPAYRVGPRNIRIKKADLDTAVTPVRLKDVALEKARTEIWAGYDPDKVRKAIEKAAGSWADLETDAMIAYIHRGREEGSRPTGRP